MKKIDLVTVLISSVTLVLFCICSYWLFSQYSQVRTDIDQQTQAEIVRIDEAIDSLNRRQSVDRAALTDQLASNKRQLQARINEWQILKQTLLSFIAILCVTVISHLFFVSLYVRKLSSKIISGQRSN